MLPQFVWLCFILLLGYDLRIPAADPNGHGLAIWMQMGATLFLYLYVFLTALGVGRTILQFIQHISRLERYLLSLLIGLATLADGIMIIGLLHYLFPFAIFIWLALSGLVASFQYKEIHSEIREKFSSLKRIRLKDFSAFEYLLFAVIGFFIILLPVVAISPVRDYDALMYHLEIPRQYLEHGGIYFNPAAWRSAYPMLTEMLFTIGIIFHLEPFSQLISLTFAIIFILSIYAFGRRFFSSKIALLAIGILLGNLATPIYATSPGVEFSSACFEFWSLYAFSIWVFEDKAKKQTVWLAAAGVMIGLAASVKYLSLPSMLVIGLLVIVKTIQFDKPDRKKIAQNILAFGLPALVIIAPWYLKNWVWTGNPFYPLIFGGPGWSSLRNELFHDYMGSFGMGWGWRDYLILPINLYIHQPRFATMSLEIFSPVLWLAFAFIFVKKWRQYDYLVAYIFLGFIIWAGSEQVIRFLLPLSGFLALLSAKVLSQFSRLIQKTITIGVVGGLMIVAVAYQIWLVADSSLLNYINGQFSANEFLQKEVYDYKATQFIQKNLQPTDRVLFLWDGHGYYCGDRCVPDDDETLAIQLSIDSPSPETLAHQLHSKGITHILLGLPTAYWFISLHDPKQQHQFALDYFEKTFLPACAKQVYQDGQTELFSLTCQ
jgi:4-amino-4-deoxy-L-arabinose transferase-like glycosyltransferase